MLGAEKHRVQLGDDDGAFEELVCSRIDEIGTASHRKQTILSTIFPDVSAFRVRIFFKIVFVTFLFLTHSADVPDEWWQCNEIAYQVAMRYLYPRYGSNISTSLVPPVDNYTLTYSLTFEERFGAPSWEWQPQHQLRSFVHPAPVAITFISITYIVQTLWGAAVLVMPSLLERKGDNHAGGGEAFVVWLESLLYYLAPRIIGCIVACALHMSTIRVAQLLYREKTGISLNFQSSLPAEVLYYQRKRLHAVFRLTTTIITSSFMFAYTSPRLLSNCAEALALMYAFEELGKVLLTTTGEEENPQINKNKEYIEGPVPGGALNRKRLQEQEMNTLLKKAFEQAEDQKLSVWGTESRGWYWGWCKLLTVAGVGCCMRCTFVVPIAVVMLSFLVADMRRGTTTSASPESALGLPKIPVSKSFLATQRFVMFVLMALAAVIFWVSVQVGVDSVGYRILYGGSTSAGDGISPVFTILNFVKFNFISGHSALFGAHPFHWYFTVAMPANLGPLILFLLILCVPVGRWKELRTNKKTADEEKESSKKGAASKTASDRSTIVLPPTREESSIFQDTLVSTIIVTCVFTMTILSFLSHKEMRFIFPVTTCPVIAIVVGRLIPDWAMDASDILFAVALSSSENPTESPTVLQLRRFAVVLLRQVHTICTVSTVVLLAFFGWGFKSGPTQVVHSLRRGTFLSNWSGGSNTDVISTIINGLSDASAPLRVHVLAGCYTLPGHSTFHVPIAVDTELVFDAPNGTNKIGRSRKNISPLHNNKHNTQVESSLKAATAAMLRGDSPPLRGLQEIAIHSVSCADMDVDESTGRRAPTEPDLYIRDPLRFMQYAYEGAASGKEGTISHTRPSSKISSSSSATFRSMVEGPLATLTRYGGGIIRWISTLQSKQPEGMGDAKSSSKMDDDASYDQDIQNFHRRVLETTFNSGPSSQRRLAPPPHAAILGSVTAVSATTKGQHPLTPLPDIFITFSRPPTNSCPDTTTNQGESITTVSNGACTTEDPITRFFHRNGYELLESHLHTTIVVDEGSGHWLEIWGRKSGQ